MPHASGPRYWSLIAISAILALPPIAAGCGQRKSAPRHQLRVLVISPQPTAEPALGIGAFLSENGIKTTTIPLSSTTTSIADSYDLVVIAGTGDITNRSLKPLALHKPVLAMGHYGCSYLGLLQLKNGWPYT